MPRLKSSFFFISFFSIWGILIYSNTFSSSFHYDDYFTIVEPPYAHWDDLSWENFKKLLLPEHGRPVAYLTFALNYYFGGLDVRGYHYVNIGIHILTATGFFLFLKTILALPRFGEDVRRRSHVIAFIAALLWLSSPLQTQAVTYIVQRMASLGAMFYIYAIYFYLKGRLNIGRLRHIFYILSCIFILLAFGTKQNTYTLPFYMILLEVIIIKGDLAGFLFTKKALILLSFFIFSFAAMLWYLYYVPWAGEPGQWVVYLIKTRVLTGCRIIVFYISQLLIPVPSRLSLEYDFQLSRGLFDPQTSLFAMLAVSGSVIYATLSWKKKPLFSFFTLWFFGNLAIETFYPYLILVFEHRLYLPSMGFFTLTAIGINKLFNGLDTTRSRVVMFSMGIFIIASFSINTYIRNNTWRDAYSLWSDVIKKSPGIATGYVNLATAYAKDEDYSNAISNYQKAKSIDPRNPIIRYDLGATYFSLKMYEEAINEFRYLGSMGYLGMGDKRPISYYFARIAKNYYGHFREKAAIQLIDEALVFDPNEPELKELKDKMEKGTITFTEIMQK